MSESIESFVTRCAAIIRWHMSHLPPGEPTIRTQSPEDTDCSGTILAGCRANGWYLFTDGYPSGTVDVDGEDVEVFDHFRVVSPSDAKAPHLCYMGRMDLGLQTPREAILERLSPFTTPYMWASVFFTADGKPRYLLPPGTTGADPIGPTGASLFAIGLPTYTMAREAGRIYDDPQGWPWLR